MTDVRFLSSNSVSCEANDVKFETLMQGSRVHKLLGIVEIGQRVCLCMATLYQKAEIFHFCGVAFAPTCTNWCVS